MVAKALSIGEGTGCQSTSITDADTAHNVENLKKLNFEVLEHPLYSLDLTPSDSPVWSTALLFLSMKHTVWTIIDSPSYVNRLLRLIHLTRWINSTVPFEPDCTMLFCK